jgi:hypothetical protein
MFWVKISIIPTICSNAKNNQTGKTIFTEILILKLIGGLRFNRI